MPLMAAFDADAERLPATDAVDRALGWETEALQPYVDYYSFDQQRSDIESQARHAPEYWEWFTRTRDRTAVNITLVESDSKADMVIRRGELPCATLTAGSCPTWNGTDTNADEKLESCSRQQINIREISAEKVGWDNGSNPIYTLGGARTVQHGPEPFIRASDHERRTLFERFR